MKKLLASLLGLALALAVPALCFAQGQAIGPPNYAVCNKSLSFGPVDGAGGIAVLTQVVAAASSPLGPGGVFPGIYVCGFTFTNTAAAGVVRLVAGTGATCGSNTVNLTNDLSVGTSQVTIYSTPPSIVTPVATATTPGSPYALCVKPSVNTITGIIWFGQF